jgi:hypothetical protein
MTWWKPWTWFAPATPQHTSDDGFRLFWPARAWPLVVYLDDTAIEWQDEVRKAIETINANAGRWALMHAVAPTLEIIEIFDQDPRLKRWPTYTVMVSCDAGSSTPGHTVHEHAKPGAVGALPGECNAAKVTLRPMFMVNRAWADIVLQEMLHVCTLGHSTDMGSVMYHEVGKPGQRLTAADVRGLRKVVSSG